MFNPKYVFLVLIFFPAFSQATLIECPLDLAGSYDITEGRDEYFDFGYEFTDIYNVYMDWQGSISACYYEDIREPGILYPSAVSLSAWFGENPIIGHASVEGGYDPPPPTPTLFDEKSDGHLFRDYTWESFYDGKGRVAIGYSAPGGNLWHRIVETTPITVDSVKIVIEGEVVPEPMTFMFLVFGASVVYLKRSS